MRKFLTVIAATLLSFIAFVMLVGCDKDIVIECITDIDFYADMQEQADKIDVDFDNDTQEGFKFSITGESDIKEIMEIIFSDSLFDLGKQLKPPGSNTNITIYQGEKAYSLGVQYINSNGRLYSFSTRDLSNKIYDLATARGAFEDPYKDYVSSGLEAKTQTDRLLTEGGYHNKWHSDTELKLYTSYSEYMDLEIDLGYTEAYFEFNSLLIFLRTGCSSDNLQFVEVLANDGKLYPVLERNYIGPNDPVTEDIIYYIFYVEVPNNGNYSAGEVINKTRAENTYYKF